MTINPPPPRLRRDCVMLELNMDFKWSKTMKKLLLILTGFFVMSAYQSHAADHNARRREQNARMDHYSKAVFASIPLVIAVYGYCFKDGGQGVQDMWRKIAATTIVSAGIARSECAQDSVKKRRLIASIGILAGTAVFAEKVGDFVLDHIGSGTRLRDIVVLSTSLLVSAYASKKLVDYYEYIFSDHEPQNVCSVETSIIQKKIGNTESQKHTGNCSLS